MHDVCIMICAALFNKKSFDVTLYDSLCYSAILIYITLIVRCILHFTLTTTITKTL